MTDFAFLYFCILTFIERLFNHLAQGSQTFFAGDPKIVSKNFATLKNFGDPLYIKIPSKRALFWAFLIKKISNSKFGEPFL